MAMKKNNRDYIAQMNKGMKQKLSMLLIACLLFTGYHGLTISGRAEQEEKEQTNEISVSGTQVKIQLLGEDIRRAAKEAIEKGDRVEAAALQGYSGDEDLQKEYAEIFSSEKEVYEIPLDSISEGLSESLAEEEAGLQVFVERDAKDLERLVRKESKESLLLYDKNSQLTQLFPKNNQEETKATVEKEQESGAEEALASDSNIEKTERNTELTGSELITFLYKNKADHRISFQLSVDGNTYPKVVVSPKTQLFKSFLDKLKKDEKKPKTETESAEVKESKRENAETKVASENTESNEPESSVSSVSLVSTEGSEEETTVAENVTVETAMEASAEEESIAEESTEAEAGEAETTVSETVAETALETKDTEVKKDKAIFGGFLQEVIEHYEEFLGELQTARFTQYSLNELGRKTQNVEIKGFVTVEVFYDEDAFDEEVVLEAKRLVKPEEEGEKEGEKLTEEQIKAMKEQDIYNNSDALDIRFVSKKDQKEVEPKDNNTVTVRLTFDKKVVPEGANADTIAIHHLLESKESGVVELVETVLRSETEKKAEKKQAALEEDEKQEEAEELPLDEDTKEENLQKEENAQKEEKITKEFTVDSFSPFIITWVDGKLYHGIRFYYVDREGREIGPTKYYRLTDRYQRIQESPEYLFYKRRNYDRDNQEYIDSRIKYTPDSYKLVDLFGISKRTPGAIYNGVGYGITVYKLSNQKFEWGYGNNYQGAIHFDAKCAYEDFVFVYELCQAQNNIKHPDETTVDLRNEKYITDNQDGTYELTLTGQIEKKNKENKQPLDIVFVYDNTDIMATNFNFDGTRSDTERNYVNDADRKSTEVKAQIKSFMEKMSASSSPYDVRYALVTMDGSKETTYDLDYRKDYTTRHKNGFDGWYYDPHVTSQNGYGPNHKDWKGYKPGTNLSDRFHYFPGIEYDDYNYPNYKYVKGDINLVGEFQGWKNGKADLEAALDERKERYQQLSTNFEITDNSYNDTKYVRKFTSEPATIISDLDSLSEERTTVTKKTNKQYTEKISGENYAAAIANVKALLHNEDASIKAKTTAAGYSVRGNARKVVIFIAGGDAKYSYIKSTYQYDDVLRFDGNKYYKTRGRYEEGYSIGNGRAIDFAALNQARGELYKIRDVDAFYSIGVGNKNNWQYLNDFAMGQLYDENGKKKTNINPEDEKKKREKALVNGILYKNFDGSTKEKLQSSFDDIFNKVAGAQVKNIEITDILTKYVKLVEPYNTAVEGQLVKMRPNTNADQPDLVVDHVLKKQEMKDMGLEGFNIVAGLRYIPEYNGNRQVLTLKTNPEDFSLPQGYEIRMVAKVELTDDAKKYFKEKDDYPHVGGDRTDLESIFQTYLKVPYTDPDNRPAERFSTSAGKPGFYTNEKAEIKYKNKKPNGGEEGGKKEYKKPVVRPNGYLKIEKLLEGIGEGFINTSTGELTELGKKIMKQMSFTIYEDEKELLTFNVGDLIGKPQPVKIAEKYDVSITAVQKVGDKYKFEVTVNNIPLNRKYRIKENDISKNEILSDGTYSYQFMDLKPYSNETLTLNSIYKSTLYTLTNIYKPVIPNKTVTIEKQVEELAGVAISGNAQNDQFDFYLVLYKKGEEGAYGRPEYQNYLATLSGNQYDNVAPVKITVKTTGNTEEDIWALHFLLNDNTKISFPLKGDTEFRVFEMRKDGYDAAKVESTSQSAMSYKEEEAAGKIYTSTNRLTNQGQTVVFKNPRITVVPTGLRGDLTPYLFSIFGFTLMAGAYFVINQKKRREI